MREEDGRTFKSIAEYFNNDIKDFDIKYIVSHGSDVNFNLLLIEYLRHDLDINVFKDKVIINTKQFMWKKSLDERLDSIDCCKVLIDGNKQTKLQMTYSLLKFRTLLKRD